MHVTYVGPFDEVEIAATGQIVKAGETFEVSADLGGRAPTGELGEEGYDPGEGLLAQSSNFVAAKAPRAKPEPSASTDSEE